MPCTQFAISLIIFDFCYISKRVLKCWAHSDNWKFRWPIFLNFPLKIQFQNFPANGTLVSCLQCNIFRGLQALFLLKLCSRFRLRSTTLLMIPPIPLLLLHRGSATVLDGSRLWLRWMDGGDGSEYQRRAYSMFPSLFYEIISFLNFIWTPVSFSRFGFSTSGLFLISRFRFRLSLFSLVLNLREKCFIN